MYLDPSSLFTDISFKKYAKQKKNFPVRKCLENTVNKLCLLESHYVY